ncbi:MAG: helix-turn-helix domain-containing protein [Acetivibrionales bacterium]|jgi:transcriptional regulator with XRE-family HTH domain
MEKLAYLIKVRREKLNLSLRDFGNLCGVSHSYIRNLEDGDPRTGRRITPTLSCLEKLAPALDMSLEKLLKEVGYINSEGDKFDCSNLRLLRGDKTYEEIAREISEKTGEKVEPSLYEAIEKGYEKDPSPIFIDVLAKFANVDSSFFYRKNSPQLLEYTRNNFPYQYAQSGQEGLLYVKEEIREFISDPASDEYLMFAKELKEKGINLESIRKIVFEK